MREQAVVRVRERKHRQEGKGPPALSAAARTNLDPVVILVMRLLAAASVADDRIAVTTGQWRVIVASQSSAQSMASFDGATETRDELNRNSQGFRPGVDPPSSRPMAAAPPPPEENSNYWPCYLEHYT